MLAVVVAGSLCGCSSGPTKREQELAAQVSRYEAHDSEVREKIEALETATSELDDQIGRFDSEDWSDVVEDLKNAKDEVIAAKDDLDETVN